MLNVDKLLDAAARLNDSLRNLDEPTLHHATGENAYFTERNIRFATKSIQENFLDPENLKTWLSRYGQLASSPKRIGLVMAGNIPLVGFHDLLCVVFSGHHALVKLSHKDSALMRLVIDKWNELAGESRIEIVERLNDADAVIATGSDNTARYFEYYFGQKPHIFRKNRNGVAVLSGEETYDQLKALADDVFLYFGLGCRSVSKLYVPVGYKPDQLLEHFSEYEHVMNCTPYRNNFEYQHAINLVNKEVFLTNGFVIVKGSEHLASPVAVLYYEFYKDLAALNLTLEANAERIQCVVGQDVAFGQSQRPGLSDYADGIDVLEWLHSLN